ncbi:MAG TPA: hypothetical protein VI942_08940, partial [Thermoanaerobaculia bacterium]|nr:hypothetical protein [Thermoanaerobaculia bacterium]
MDEEPRRAADGDRRFGEAQLERQGQARALAADDDEGVLEPGELTVLVACFGDEAIGAGLERAERERRGAVLAVAERAARDRPLLAPAGEDRLRLGRRGPARAQPVARSGVTLARRIDRLGQVGRERRALGLLELDDPPARLAGARLAIEILSAHAPARLAVGLDQQRL